MKNIWLQSLIITVFVFFSLWAVSKVTDLKLFNAFDAIGTALKDFELTDYALQQLREVPKIDENIVLVNIGNLTRGGIAQEIHIISQYQPKVIGIDALFRCEGGLRDTINCPNLLDTLGNMMLSAAIQEAKVVVLGDKILQKAVTAKTDSNVGDSIEFSDPIFQMYAKRGFVTLPTDANYQGDAKICKTVFPKFTIEGKDELAFSTQLAMQFDSVAAKKYLARNIEEEIINFRGNIEIMTFRTNSLKNDDAASAFITASFSVIDVDQVFKGDFDKSFFKDKIVMMGYLGAFLGDNDWEDKFFTPMNKKIAGRANPDMFGLVIHANTVAMILAGDFINTLPDPVLYAIAFLVCLLTVALLIKIDNNLPAWFDALSFFVQVALLIVVSAAVIFAFTEFNLKLELAVTLGVSALVGPCYDIFKSIQNEVIRRFTKAPQQVLKE